MKGISAIISVILLLLITIAVIGFAFVFFSRVTSTAGAAAENQTQEQIIQLSKQVAIDGFTSTSVSIRSTGTRAVNAGEVQVYVSGAPRTCTPALTSITPGTVQTCSFTPACTTGQVLRVAGPANQVDQNC